MIKREKNLIFLIIITLALMTGCDITGKGTSKKEIFPGYCPTMEKLSKEIQINNNNVVLKPFDSTSSAFSSLNSGSVDVILVGRL